MGVWKRQEHWPWVMLWMLIGWPPAELPAEPEPLSRRNRTMLCGLLLVLAIAIWNLSEPFFRR